MVKDTQTTEDLTTNVENNGKQAWAAPEFTNLTTGETNANPGSGGDGGTFISSLS